MRSSLALLLLAGCALTHEEDVDVGLFLPRQTILVPVGLVSQPNQYGQYPSGALKVARNFVMRNPGELVQAPDVQGAVSLTGLTNDIVKKLMPLDDGHVYAFMVDGTTWAIREGAGSSNSVSTIGVSATNQFSQTGRLQFSVVAGRALVNGERGFLVGDYLAPTSSAERGLRMSGLVQPTFRNVASTSSGNGVIPVNTMVGYSACFTRTLPSGLKLVSVPSPTLRIINGAVGSTNYEFEFQWTGVAAAIAQINAGDVLELYRTDLLATTDPSADPGETLKLVASHIVSSAEAAAREFTVTDVQPAIPGTSITPGRELYTNPGQEGSTYSNRQAPASKCVADFKGFAFVANTTERPQWVFSIPGGLGRDADAAASGMTSAQFKANGIGVRSGSGTITNGSPTVTGVSAANMVGITVGQRWWVGAGFTAGVHSVISVGASSFTMSANANANGAAFELVDVYELNGLLSFIPQLGQLINNGAGAFELTSDVTLDFSSSGRVVTGFEITYEPIRQVNANQLTVRATNGHRYSPPVPEITDTAQTLTEKTTRNRIQWSKEQQPEHFPAVSEAFVGFGEIYAMNATRDALWIWCSDGLFRLSGHAGALGLGAWQIDYANSTLILAAPQASTVLNEFMYAYTNVGFVEVDSAGNVVNLTDKIIGDILPGQKYVETAGIVVERNETDEEVLVILGENGNGSSNTVYVFNTKQRGWTSLSGNGASLSNITAMAMQRSPISGEPRVLFGVSPLAGGVPSYSGWNSPSSFLTAEIQYQPIYGDDPLELKKWIWADYLFDSGSNNKTIVPTWNGTQYGGNVAIQAFDQGGYARAGCPLEVGHSHSVSPGFRSLAGAPQSRFQGISVALKQRTNQSKRR